MIDTYEVRKLLAQRDSEDSFSRERTQRKLDKIANAIRFSGEGKGFKSEIVWRLWQFIFLEGFFVVMYWSKIPGRTKNLKKKLLLNFAESLRIS